MLQIEPMHTVSIIMSIIIVDLMHSPSFNNHDVERFESLHDLWIKQKKKKKKSAHCIHKFQQFWAHKIIFARKKVFIVNTQCLITPSICKRVNNKYLVFKGI